MCNEQLVPIISMLDALLASITSDDARVISDVLSSYSIAFLDASKVQAAIMEV